MSSTFTYRLRAPPGLDSTLVKELKTLSLKGINKGSIVKIPGRKAVEVKGQQGLLWDLIAKSRITEDIQVKVCHSFMARGEKELTSNF
jgi:hypothetical protein